MKIKIVLSAVCAFACLTLTNCTNNPKDDDPTSTITPGNKLEVDSATAHRNNTDSIAEVKNNRADSSANQIEKHSLDSKQNVNENNGVNHVTK